jgi:hypothetical protein
MQIARRWLLFLPWIEEVDLRESFTTAQVGTAHAWCWDMPTVYPSVTSGANHG